MEVVMLRPFTHYVERGKLPMLEFVGKIEEDRYVVTVSGYRAEFKTAKIEKDARGPFAHVICAEVPLTDATLVLEVEHQPDEIAAGHEEISGGYLWLNVAAERPRSFGVGFSADGFPDGGGSVGNYNPALDPD